MMKDNHSGRRAKCSLGRSSRGDERFVLELVLATLAASPGWSQTVTSLKLIVFLGVLSWPIFVAEDRRFFAGQKLDVAVTFTPGSLFQMKGILTATSISP